MDGFDGGRCPFCGGNFAGPMHPGFARGFAGPHPQWGGHVAEGWAIGRAPFEGPRGPQAAEGHQHHKHAGKHDGKHDGKPGEKKPGNWQPGNWQPRAEGRADNDRIDSIEARLAALEEQQAATLAMVQEEHTAVMAALEKTNELLTVKLNQLDQMQERMAASFGHPGPNAVYAHPVSQRGVHSVARAERNAPPRDRGWDDDDDRD
jgi:hypothetical protein